MKKSILVVALSEFQHSQKDTLFRMVDHYSEASDPNSVWNCICNCVDLWRSAQEALDELSKREGEI